MSASFRAFPFENSQIVTVLNGAFCAKNGGTYKNKRKIGGEIKIMITGIKKKDKTTEIYFNEKDNIVEIRTYNTDLKNRLTAYAKDYPTLCRLTDDDECGRLTFEIEKQRFSVRLTKPYTEQRRQSARETMTALNKRRE